MAGEWQYEPITVGSPAVASGFTHNVPGSQIERVLTLCFDLTTDGNAANRFPWVDYLNAESNTFFSVAAPFVLTASKTSRFSFGVGLQQYGADDAAFIGTGLPDLQLCMGLGLTVNVAGVQAGDQISGISLFVAQRSVRD